MNPKWESIYRERHAVETHYEWSKWQTDVPYLTFREDWKVRVIPPFGGAVVRFLVRRDDTPEGEVVSVYLDCYGELGAMDRPYWEIYPAEDGDTDRFYMAETDELLAGIAASLDAMAEVSR